MTQRALPPPPVITQVLDRQGANTGPLNPFDRTDDHQPQLSGTAQRFARLMIYDGNRYIGQTDADMFGNWTFIPTIPLSDGGHEFSAVDYSGGLQRSEPFPIIVTPIDATTPNPPSPPTINVYDDVNEAGFIKHGGTTDDRIPTLSGSAQPYAMLQILINGRQAGYATANAQGQWRYDAYLEEGLNSLQVVDPNNGQRSDVFQLTVQLPEPIKTVITNVYDDVGETGFVDNGGTTDDRSPTLRGSAQPNTTLQILINGRHAGYTTTNAQGQWRYDAYLEEGLNSLQVVNPGNGQRSDVFQLTVQLPEPIKTVITNVYDDVGETGFVDNGGTTDDRSPTLSGSAQPNAMLQILINGRHAGYATTNAQGEWRYNAYLEEGLNSLQVVNPGNGQRSDVFQLTVQLPEPIKTVITNVYDDVGETGFVDNGGTTDDRTPTFSGTAQPNTTLQILINGRHAGYATTNAQGQWRYNAYLEEGLNSLQVVNPGNGQRSDVFQLTVQLPEPIKTVITNVYDDVGETGFVDNGGTTDDRTPTFSGTAQPNTTLQILINGRHAGYATTNAQGQWRYNAYLEEGLNSLQVVNPGNGQRSDVFQLTVQLPEPIKTVITNVYDDVGETGFVDNGGTTDDRSPTLSGSAQPNAMLQILINGRHAGYATANAQGEWRYNAYLEEGLNSLQVVNPGNGQRSDVFQLTVQLPEPIKTVITNVYDDVGETGFVDNGGTTDDRSPTLSGSAQPNAMLQILINGRHAGYATANAQGEWRYNAYLEEGLNSLQVVNPGNGQRSDVFQLTVQLPEPIKTVITNVYDDVGETGFVDNGGTTDDRSPTLSGSAQPNAMLQILINGRHAGYATANAQGEWRYNAYLEEGLNSLQVVNPGNGQRSDVFQLTVQLPEQGKHAIISAYDDVGEHAFIPSGGVTDDHTPLLRGTANAYDHVQVFSNGIMLGRTMANANGQWEYAAVLGLGLNSLNIYTSAGLSEAFVITVVAPQASGPTITHVYDNVGEFGFIEKGQTTDDRTPGIMGNAAPDTLVEIFSNGQKIGQVMTNANGSWNYSPYLQNGVHSLTARTDSGVSEPFVITVQAPDTSNAPRIEAMFDFHGEYQGELGDGATTDDRAPLIVGRADGQAIVQIFANGTLIHTLQASNSGMWSINVPLHHGTHVITVQSNGMTSEPFTVSIVDPAIARESNASALNATEETGAQLTYQDLFSTIDQLFEAPAMLVAQGPSPLDIDEAAFNDATISAGVMINVQPALPPLHQSEWIEHVG